MTAAGVSTLESLQRRVLQEAFELGFVRAGIVAPQRSEPAAERLRRWLAAGHHGEMHYLEPGLDRSDPSALLPSVKSVLVVALPYGDPAPVRLRRSADGPVIGSGLVGRVARYARGEDYHRIIKSKLERLGRRIEGLVGRPVGRRACVDSAPLLERDLAERAGLGFSAKSTLTIVPGAGSFVFLAELLLDLELPPTPPAVAEGCGKCTRCLTACPTGAFVAPHVLDARRCISYLTIELKGAIPRELRSLLGNHVFGCDICQDVCPWNATRLAPLPDAELGGRAELDAPELPELLFLTSARYRKLVRGTALSRVSRQRLARNAAVALGNSRRAEAEAPLARALVEHPSALVRLHAAWALQALERPLQSGLDALERARSEDVDADVRAEASWALSSLGAGARRP